MAEAINLKPITPHSDHSAPLPGLPLKPLQGAEKHSAQQHQRMNTHEEHYNPNDNSFYLPPAAGPSTAFQAPQIAAHKLPSPSNQTDGGMGAQQRFFDPDNSMFGVNQVLATSTDGSTHHQQHQQPPRHHGQQRNSKQRKQQHPQGQEQYPKVFSNQHNRVNSNPVKGGHYNEQMSFPMPHGHDFQSFNLPSQMFHPSQMNATQPHFNHGQHLHQSPMLPQQVQAPHQVHFIAKQQKFYQISPSRAAEMNPILFDKRPYTSSMLQQVLNKRSSGNGGKGQSSAIAALYLAQQNKAPKLPTSNEIMALANAQNAQIQNQLSQMQGSQAQSTPYQAPKKRLMGNLSVPRSKNHATQIFTQDHEQLFEEAVKLKQENYDLKDENSRLKTRVKMHDTEMIRKDKTIEDFFQQNQFIQNAQKTAGQANSQLAPIAATAQKYQQETFLLMSLKKQVKQLKQELQKKDELMSTMKQGKGHQKIQELEYEIDIYREELLRMRGLLTMQAEAKEQSKGPTEMTEDAGSEKYMNQTKSDKYNSEMATSESNQAHVISRGAGQMTPNLENGSVEQLYESDQRLVEMLHQREAQIMDLQDQLQAMVHQQQRQSSQQLQQSTEKSQVEHLKQDLQKNKKLAKETSEKYAECQKLVKVLQLKETTLDSKVKELERELKNQQTKTGLMKDQITQRDEKVAERDAIVAQLDKKVKSLKETISKIQLVKPQPEPEYKLQHAPKGSQRSLAESKTSSKSIPTGEQKQSAKSIIEKSSEVAPAARAPPSREVQDELNLVCPIIATNHKITDRLFLVQELKQGLPVYRPSSPVEKYLAEAPVHEIALCLPSLVLAKARLDSYNGEVGEEVVCDFLDESCKIGGETPTLEQRQYIMARYLAGCQGTEVYVNTAHLADDLASQKRAQRKKSVSDEQMLDIAEMCFVRMAEILIRQGITVREAFTKYSVPEMLPQSKTVLELIIPSAFFEAIKAELRIKELSDLEAACLMRVLAKPELGNAIILNEFALIMENFGVPLVDGTLSDEEDYTPDGQDKPLAYDITKIDEAGSEILQQVARYLLKEYQHPREFFGKMVKPNVEIKTERKTYRLDTLSVKDFYLKVKIANIRKNLQENESLNRELCLDPVSHPTLFNMKTFVRALEDIAEIEQEKIFVQEKAEEEKLQQEKAQAEEAKGLASVNRELEKQKSSDKLPQSAQPGTSPNIDKADSPSKSKDLPSDYEPSISITPEVVGLGKPRGKKGRSPNPISKFQALGTIEEAINETATSIKDDESRMGSNNLRSSHMIDLEDSGNISQHKDSMQRVDLLNRSLTDRDAGNATTRNPELTKSFKSDQPGRLSTEPLQTQECEDGEDRFSEEHKSEKGEDAGNVNEIAEVMQDLQQQDCHSQARENPVTEPAVARPEDTESAQAEEKATNEQNGNLDDSYEQFDQ